MSGPAAIPVSEVTAYLALVRVDSADESVKYLRIVQQLDQVYLSHWQDKYGNK